MSTAMIDDLLGTRDLVQLARAGDREALDLLVRRTYPGVVTAARSLRKVHARIRGRVETEDLAQSAFRDAVRVLPTFRERGDGSFRRWLLGILRNKVRRHVAFFGARRRDAGREAHLPEASDLPSPAPPPPAVLLEREERGRLVDAVNRLPERDRKVVVCRYHLGLSWKEVGDRLGTSEEAAQMACHRALVKLRRALDAGT
jgi:RNA polymerase sigma factor (sigma-70 family)